MTTKNNKVCHWIYVDGLDSDVSLECVDGDPFDYTLIDDVYTDDPLYCPNCDRLIVRIYNGS